MSSTAAAVDLPTPDVSHLKSADYENVYEPVEDSFLLLDALQSDAAELKAQRSAWCISVLLEPPRSSRHPMPDWFRFIA